MGRKFVVVLLFVGACASAAAQTAVRVSSSRDLVRAIGSDRTVTLAPGRYVLTEAADISSSAVSWRETYDGPELVIRGVRNLTLRAEPGVTLLADPRYAYTFSFIDCREVALSGLSAGHTEAGDCDGGVLSFVGCTGVRIDGCDLFGSGTIGVFVADSSGITVRASTIRDCTYGALSALAVQDLRLERVVMMRNGAYPVVSLEASPGVVMDSCQLEDNEGSQLFWVGQDSSLALPRSRITRNTVEVIFYEDSGVPELSGAIVENNSLGMADKGETYDEGYEEYQEGYPEDEEVGENGEPFDPME